MNIIDVKNMYSGSKYEGKLDRAVRLFEKTGDDVKSGYLGSVITNIGFDNLGNFEFSSEHMASNLETKSTGALLDEGAVIKQIQENDKEKFYQIFSWNNDFDKYTYVLFDSEEAMNFSYEKLKAAEMNLCDGELREKLVSLHIPLSDILQVQQNVEMESPSLLVEEEKNDEMADELGGKII